jgi:hypothetical protein
LAARGAGLAGFGSLGFAWKINPQCLHFIDSPSQLDGMRSEFLHPGHWA